MKYRKKLENLHEVFKTREGPLKAEMKKKTEKIERIKEETMKFPKKRCRKLWMGVVDFSPTLENLGNVGNDRN